jgi:hypothetical protein
VDPKVLALESEVRALRIELQNATNEIDLIVNSKTWKITAPLRSFFNLLRKFKMIKQLLLSSIEIGRSLDVKVMISYPMTIPSAASLLLTRIRRKVRLIKEEALPNRLNSIEEFWREAHKTNATRWITGSSPIDELGYLGVLNEFRGGTTYKVLIVGVGDGSTANYLSRRGHDVEVLDVTSIAFKNLVPTITKKHLVSDYSSIKELHFDYVLHHLVAQHMQDNDLKIQFGVLIDSLNRSGKLKMQFASSLVRARNDLPQDLSMVKRGEILRSINSMENLVSGSRDVFYEITEKLSFPSWKEGWCWYLLSVSRIQES